MTSLRVAWADTLVADARRNERIVLLDADLATSTKGDTFAAALPGQFMQMGIAEQNMVAAAAGLSDHGFIPWMSSFAVFFTHRALDPIRMLVAQTRANVKIAAGYSGVLTGLTGKTHQDVQDLAIMRAMPGMVVLSPGDAMECAQMVRWANEYDGPVYLRLARDAAPALPAAAAFHVGAVSRLVEGGTVVLVSTGVQSVRTVEAAALVTASTGVTPRVVHVPTIKPLDEESLCAQLAGVDLVVVVEEHSVIGGLGGLVSEVLCSRAPSPRVVRLGLQDHWGESAPNADLLDKYGLSPAALAQSIASYLNIDGANNG
ncbi:transketolase C-terminal domain-containing protein [Aeromicrobium sp.]|uniref:transketolase family protein n=1 Tax=Aeromicrobium sp. TaxID=1871063 RepID=UPI0030BAA6AA